MAKGKQCYNTHTHTHIYIYIMYIYIPLAGDLTCNAVCHPSCWNKYGEPYWVLFV